MKRALLAPLMMFALVACDNDGPDATVGATCDGDRDCAERCLQGGDYPGGFCSVRCVDDRDCPNDTICTDRDGGVCLYDCEISANCDFLGPDYRCRDADDWQGVRVGVCLGD